MRAFITGIGGFAGGHLAEHLRALGHAVSGLAGPEDGQPRPAAPGAEISLFRGDLRDRAGLEAIVREARPDWVFHLAGQSSVAASWEDPAATLEANAVGGIHLLDACLALGGRVRVVVASSMEVHGAGPPGAVLTEEAPFAPVNPYAVSKLSLDLLAGQYAAAKGLEVVRLRLANHTGPRQSPRAVVSDFARQVAEIEAGRREAVMRVGNLEAARDFLDVRDVARAYVLAAGRGRAGEAYLVCSGKMRKISEILDALRAMARVPIGVEPDPAKHRPVDPSAPPASAERFTARTGWRPEIPFGQTLEDTLNDWRGRLAAGGE